MPIARFHQQIGVRLLLIICFTPKLWANIGKYLLLLRLFVCKKFCYYLLLLYQGSKPHLLQLFEYYYCNNWFIISIISIIAMNEIILYYCTLLKLIFSRLINCVIAINHIFGNYCCCCNLIHYCHYCTWPSIIWIIEINVRFAFYCNQLYDL